VVQREIRFSRKEWKKHSLVHAKSHGMASSEQWIGYRKLKANCQELNKINDFSKYSAFYAKALRRRKARKALVREQERMPRF